MVANLSTMVMTPLMGLAQLDIFGFLTGPEGRTLGANLIGSMLLDLITALIGALFQVTL